MHGRPYDVISSIDVVERERGRVTAIIETAASIGAIKASI